MAEPIPSIEMRQWRVFYTVKHLTAVGRSDGVHWSVKTLQKRKGQGIYVEERYGKPLKQRKCVLKKRKNDGVGPTKAKPVKGNNGQRWLGMWGPRYRDSAVWLRNDR